MAETFGALLRERRAAAGISLNQLAKRVNYSKSYLSKLENDLKPPNATVAKLCDNELDAGGTLIDLARNTRERVESTEIVGLDRRQMLAGAGSLIGIALVGVRPVPDDTVVAGLRTSFEHLRRLGMRTSPSVVLEPLVAHVRTVQTLAANTPEPARSRLLLLAGRIAEYTGWCSQEAGNDQGALWWTRYAAELAEAGGDNEISSYAYVREAGLALYRQDPLSVIDLTQQVQQVRPASRYILGLAARREAQGHAMAGDRDAYERAMDRATTYIDSSIVDTRPYPVLGTTAPNPVELARGWALVDLGRAAEAAEVLDREVARLPVDNRRTRARFGVRRSLAHALAGEIDQSCLTLSEVIDDAAHVDSASVRLDLQELSRTLSRWRGHATVREIFPRLSNVLRRQPGIV